MPVCPRSAPRARTSVCYRRGGLSTVALPAIALREVPYVSFSGNDMSTLAVAVRLTFALDETDLGLNMSYADGAWAASASATFDFFEDLTTVQLTGSYSKAEGPALEGTITPMPGTVPCERADQDTVNRTATGAGVSLPLSPHTHNPIP